MTDQDHDEGSTDGDIDPQEMLNLPYRTLTRTASMLEYLQETRSGLHEVQSRRSGKLERFELVTFKEGDEANPKNWSKAWKWYCTMVVATTCFCVAFDSAVITSDIVGVSETFNVSQEVALLPITLFVSEWLIKYHIRSRTVTYCINSWLRYWAYGVCSTQ
jgi:hypothetical protein